MIQLSLFPTRGYGLLGVPGLVQDFEIGEPLLVERRTDRRLLRSLKSLSWGSPRIVKLERHESPADEIPTFIIGEL